MLFKDLKLCMPFCLENHFKIKIYWRNITKPCWHINKIDHEEYFDLLERSYFGNKRSDFAPWLPTPYREIFVYILEPENRLFWILKELHNISFVWKYGADI